MAVSLANLTDQEKAELRHALSVPETETEKPVLTIYDVLRKLVNHANFHTEQEIHDCHAAILTAEESTSKTEKPKSTTPTSDKK